MRMMRILFASLALSAIGAATWAAEELPFETSEVRYQTVAREQVFDAVLEAVHQATVSAQTSVV